MYFSVFCGPTRNMPGLSEMPYKEGDLNVVLASISEGQRAEYLIKCLYEAVLYHSITAIGDILAHKDDFDINQPIVVPGEPLKFISLVPLMQNVFSEYLVLHCDWDYQSKEDVTAWYYGVRDFDREVVSVGYKGRLDIIKELLANGLNPYNEGERGYNAVDFMQTPEKYCVNITCDFKRYSLINDTNSRMRVWLKLNLSDLGHKFKDIDNFSLDYDTEDFCQVIQKHLSTHPGLEARHARMVARFSAPRQAQPLASSSTVAHQPVAVAKEQEMDAEIARLKKELEIERLRKELEALRASSSPGHLTTPAYQQHQAAATVSSIRPSAPSVQLEPPPYTVVLSSTASQYKHSK